MDKAYIPTDFQGRIALLLEECGNVVSAIGVAGGFGLSGRDPRTGVSNARAILDEIGDLRLAIDLVEPDLINSAKCDEFVDTLPAPVPMLTDDEKVSQSFRLLLDRSKINLTELSRHLNLPYRTVQNYAAGTAKIPASFFLNVCAYAGVDPVSLVARADAPADRGAS